MNVTTYGLDLAKRVFQVHWVEPDTGELKRKALMRAEVAAFFARRAPGTRMAGCDRLAAIPGVGRLTATAVAVTVADARSFRSGREFAASWAWSHAKSGTGGRVKLLGISKRGDPYLRTLLIHGARSVMLTQSRADRVMDPWLKEMPGRRPTKMARTIWALLAHDRSFDPNRGRTAMAVATELQLFGGTAKRVERVASHRWQNRSDRVGINLNSVLDFESFN